MSNRLEERLDRRDFMIASITTAGASAALAVTAGAANAQGAAASSADPASGTVYTGDTIQGKKVVSALNVNDLEPGKKHFLYFQGVQAWAICSCHRPNTRRTSHRTLGHHWLVNRSFAGFPRQRGGFPNG